MFHTPIVLAPCAAVCKRIKRAKYAVCTHVLHTPCPSQIFLQKNAKQGLTFEVCIAIIAHAVRRCATEYVERWLSWSKAHDWKSCRAPKALKGSNPFLSAMVKATSGFGCSLFLVFADAAVTQNRMPCAGLFSPAHGIRFCFSLHFLTAGEFLLTFLVYCSRL